MTGRDAMFWPETVRICGFFRLFVAEPARADWIAIEANGIEPVIDSSFGPDVIAEAFAHQLSRKPFGKIRLEF